MDIYQEYIFKGKVVDLPEEYAEMIKQAGESKALSAAEYANMDGSEFALDGDNVKLFPIHDESHAITSLAMIEKNASKLTPAAFYYAMKKIAHKAVENNWYEVYKKANHWAKLAKVYWENDDSALDVGGEKTAAKLSYKDKKSLPDSAFAYVKNENGKKIRKYPIHDEAHVRAAMTYFASNYTYIPSEDRQTVARKIIAAAKREGMEIDPKSTVARIAGIKKVAHFIGDVTPPVVMEAPYDMQTEETLKVSLQKFASDKLDPKVKRDLAKELLKAAAFFKVDEKEIPEPVKKYASNSLNPEMMKDIDNRFRYYHDEEALSELRVLKQAAVQGVLEPDYIVDRLYLLDKKAGASIHWGGLVRDPVETVYA